VGETEAVGGLPEEGVPLNPAPALVRLLRRQEALVFRAFQEPGAVDLARLLRRRLLRPPPLRRFRQGPLARLANTAVHHLVAAVRLAARRHAGIEPRSEFSNI